MLFESTIPKAAATEYVYVLWMSGDEKGLPINNPVTVMFTSASCKSFAN